MVRNRTQGPLASSSPIMASPAVRPRAEQRGGMPAEDLNHRMTSNEGEVATGQGSTVEQQIEQLEEKIAALRPAAFSEEPSPATGMAMLRKARAKNDLAKARNKRDEGDSK